MNKHTLIALSLTLLSLSLVACGSEDESGDSSNNGATNNGGANNGGTNNGDPNNGDPNNGDPNNGGTNNGAVALEESYHMMEALELSKPAGPAGILNNVLATSLETGELCVMVGLTGFGGAMAPTTLMIRGDACVDNGDGTFSWSEDAMSQPAAGMIDASNTLSTNSGGMLPVLGFPVSLGEGDPLILPIRNIQFQGRLTADGIVDGVLTGAISGADGDSITIEALGGAQLSAVLGGAASQDADIDGDGTNDGWALEASFTAAAVTFAE